VAAASRPRAPGPHLDVQAPEPQKPEPLPGPIRFAILCMGRSGSTMLQTMLDSHPNIRCFGELFHPNGGFADSGNPDLSAFLDATLASEQKAAIGFKMPWNSLIIYPDVWDLFRRQQFRVILLTRENRLDQFLSMKLAIHNKMWHSFDDLGLHYPRERLHLDPVECLHHLQYFRFGDTMLREASHDLERATIDYRQLTNPTALAPIFSLLGVEPQTLTPEVVRLRQGSQRDIIENYEELRESLRGTQWEINFDD
jgi:LPS sulfotransferase NodH